MYSIKVSKTEPKDKKLVWAKPEVDGYALYMYFNGRWAPVKTAGSSSEGSSDDTPVDTHEYVDLGLPSGTLWATCNIGANEPTEYGGYFAWGETESKVKYNWNNYKFNPSGDGSTMTKYNETDELITLEAEDDAAHVLWGGNWHIPTKDQLQELIDNCTWTWGAVNKINGYTVSRNGNSIFLPAAGYCSDPKFELVGTLCSYWSLSLNTNTGMAWRFQCYAKAYQTNAEWRFEGLSIRPVMVKQ
jgi:hypothetical protein